MKTVVVTGVDRGLGFALMTKLIEDGWHVIGGHHSELGSELKKLQSDCDFLHLCQLDIGNNQSVSNFTEFIQEHSNSVDMLINNAAILGGKINSTIKDEIDYEDILTTINVNALGSMRVTNSIINLILASEDKVIVNISSEAGSIGDCNREAWYGYCMSKAALNMSAVITHQKVKQEGGRVIQIHPGYVKTYMLGHFNEQGHLEAKESARGGVLEVVEKEMKEEITKQPIYKDYKGGDDLPW